jgi:adenylyltransferase/sulfurtransferase
MNMSVTITIPTPLRRYTAGNSEMRVDAQTAGEALERLATVYADLRKHLYTDQNTLRHFVNIYVNEEDIRHGSGPDTPVKDGDTIMIVPAIAGGN